MIFAGFFFLAVFRVLEIVEVARIPEQQYRAAHSEKVTCFPPRGNFG